MIKIVVIGATSGIGKAIAQQLSPEKYVVGITGRRDNLLDELKEEDRSKYHTRSFDCTQNDATDKLSELIAEMGGVDIIIFNSGTGNRDPELDDQISKRTLNLNVIAFTHIINWSFNYFRGKGKGHIVAITSITGLRGNRFAPQYGASKSYQSNYLEALRAKSKKENYNITITDIRPGFVDTVMAQGDKVFWKAPTDKAAKQIIKAIQQKASVRYISKRWLIIATALKYIPRILLNKI